MVSNKEITAALVSGFVMLILSMIVSYAIQAVFAYNVLALAGMRTVNDPIMALFFLHSWVISFAMVLAYPYVSKSLKGDYMAKGKTFGLIVWALYGLPSAFLVYTSMDYPLGFTINSLLGTLVYMIGGAVVHPLP